MAKVQIALFERDEAPEAPGSFWFVLGQDFRNFRYGLGRLWNAITTIEVFPTFCILNFTYILLYYWIASDAIPTGGSARYAARTE